MLSQRIAGTIAQSDNFGVFGAGGLFAATMWLLAPKAPYSLAGFRAYRNSDAANHQIRPCSPCSESSQLS